MTMTEWREALYYPLGFLPLAFFSVRLLLQWIESERKKASYAGRTFWRLSLCGNVLLFAHYLIQMQLPFAILQSLNAVISFRNLDLIGEKRRLTQKRTLLLFCGAALLASFLVAAQNYILDTEEWMRSPAQKRSITGTPLWHLIGAAGGALFASRFWVQWWQAEKESRSELGKSFWWISIWGSALSLAYFLRIQDRVSVVHYAFSLLPYARNLMLIRQREAGS